MTHSNTITARDAKNHFGELLDSARQAPVHITKNGRNVAVMLSSEEFSRFEATEDAFWSSRAAAVLNSGTEFVGTKKSTELLEHLLTPDAGS